MRVWLKQLRCEHELSCLWSSIPHRALSAS
jgi:hypothetical protein